MSTCWMVGLIRRRSFSRFLIYINSSTPSSSGISISVKIILYLTLQHVFVILYRYISTALRPFSASSQTLSKFISITTLSGIRLNTKSSTKSTSALLQHRFDYLSSLLSSLTSSLIASFTCPFDSSAYSTDSLLLY